MSKILPKILSVSNTTTSGINIQAVELQFSNGEFRTFHRLEPSLKEAVMILAIEGNELLMIKEYAVGTERYELGFPKGAMDIGETPEQSANRELKEEVGMGANQFVHLRTVNTNPSFMNHFMHIFVATDLYPCKLEGDEPEPLEIVRLPLSQIDDLLQAPDFCEARNLTALYALRDYLQR
ncbi:ADP compounds hydrolase NudE [Rodentibacter caecimuris]|uniref:ADP compounds hydrolase NudE n=1 Tax=Rodentibacter caecimuris TaxID=1796644 RepID=A0ABX3KZ24_9PAST|nr:ADP compounds hydrolase NudE [Rodentibacter heylii]